MKQLVLDMPFRTALGREDFLVGACNADAVAMIDRFPDWRTPVLVVIGPAGSGKTHLAHVFAERSGAAISDARALDDAAVPTLLDHGAAVIEDVAAPLDERALFLLVDGAQRQRIPLVLTSRSAIGDWPVARPDIVSRLKLATVALVSLPDDALISGLFVKLFADRQLTVSPDVIRYLVTRIERSFTAVRELVDRLDQRSLALRRPITTSLAREALADLEKTDPDMVG